MNEELRTVKETLIPTMGDCWNSIRLNELNCEGCKYWDGCTYKNKGKIVVKGNKTKIKRGSTTHD